MAKSERRLAAIMFTDIVGYTSMAQSDEARAMKLLEKHRELIRPILIEYEGREVKTIGDAFLIEFASALQATECAVEIQKVTRNYNQASSDQILVRIGIHVGDVIHSEGDIYGDAVNIASRIEPLAQGGEICISEQVYAQVRNKVPLTFERLGEPALKNVVFPIEIYKIDLAETIHPLSSPAKGALPSLRVAVLPFLSISPDPSDEYFADGLTEELIDRLCQVRGLEVIARTSVMSFKKKEMKAAEIARELNAGTLVEGSVRKAGNKIRVTAQLINASTEGHLWSSRYDRNLEDIFVVQSDIAEQVADALSIRLLPTEKKAIEKKSTESTHAHTLYLKGRHFWNERTEEGVKKAIEYYEHAIEKDPKYALAYSGLADCYAILVNYGYVRPEEALTKARVAAVKALELDETLSDAHSSLGAVLWNEFDFKGAGREIRKALQLNPNSARAHQWYGEYLVLVEKKAEEAISEKKRSRDLDPFSPIANLNVGATFYRSGQYDAAIDEFRKAIEIFPDDWNLHLWLGTVLVMKSQYDEGISELQKALSLSADNYMVKSSLGGAYALSGRRDEALGVIDDLDYLSKKQFVSPIAFSYVYVCLGNKDEAFRWLGKAFDLKSAGVMEDLLGEAIYGERLGGDPRYDALLQRLGLNE